MRSGSKLQSYRIAARVPVIVMVLAATAVPVELRPLGSYPALDFGIIFSDVAANIAGYLPVGFVLAGLGPSRAILLAALMSAIAESSQFMAMHRTPSATDFASNVLGAALGVLVCACWRNRSVGFRISGWRALAPAALALLLLLHARANAVPTNARGTTSAGTLEARWKLDEPRGRIALDSSGHGLDGHFRTEPQRTAGEKGISARFDGRKDSVAVGHAPQLRLVGSMTISAWIKPASFPVDDAAIVSQFHGGAGYQLDTTIDRGPRTIGFKLTGQDGKPMARYGATPLAVGQWYHVAGVYDAETRALDVYLNGRQDNGPLAGEVAGGQYSSRSDVYVGRRSDLEGYEFAGSLKEVRIYSFPLSAGEIAADMRGDVIRRGSGKSSASAPAPSCAVLSEIGDERIPGTAAVIGVLVAVACLGLWPSAPPLFCCLASLLAGLLLIPATICILPSFNLWMLPAVSLAGGASVAFPVSRQRGDAYDIS